MRKFYAMEARGEIPKGTAERWSEETSNIRSLPEKVGKKRRFSRLVKKRKKVMRNERD